VVSLSGPDKGTPIARRLRGALEGTIPLLFLVLDDRPSCPRSQPQRLTYGEVEAIGGTGPFPAEPSTTLRSPVRIATE
jgi:hypothetical protein